MSVEGWRAEAAELLARLPAATVEAMPTLEAAQFVAQMRRAAAASSVPEDWPVERIGARLPQLLALAEAMPRRSRAEPLEFPPFAGGPEHWKPEWAARALSRSVVGDG